MRRLHIPVRARSARVRVHVVVAGVGVVAGRLRHRAVVRDPPVVHDDRPGRSAARSGPSSCATSSTVPPPATNSPSASANASWLAASTPAVGSSRTSSSGWPARARAISVRCCWPPERVATGSPARSARPTAASAVATAARSAAPRRAEDAPAGQPAGRRPPRRPSPARRCRRRSAAARTRSAPSAGTGAAACRTASISPRAQRDQAEDRRGSGWTCRSRWRRGSRPPRRAGRSSETSRSTGAAVVADDGVR